MFGSKPLDDRQDRYTMMLTDALRNPFANARNIYFGLLMGVSASLPTCVYVELFFRVVVVRVNRNTRDPTTEGTV